MTHITRRRLARLRFTRCAPFFLMIYTTALLAFSTTVAAGDPQPQTRDPYQYFFHQSFNDLQEEGETVRQEGKTGVMVMFSDVDCPWCQKMKATILNQVPVQDYYRKHFQAIHLETRGDTMMSDFDGTEYTEKDYAFKALRVRATPVFVFFDPEGKVLLRYTGATRSVEEFLLLGEFVTSGKYKTTKFTRYKRDRLTKLAP